MALKLRSSNPKKIKASQRSKLRSLNHEKKIKLFDKKTKETKTKNIYQTRRYYQIEKSLDTFKGEDIIYEFENSYYDFVFSPDIYYNFVFSPDI